MYYYLLSVIKFVKPLHAYKDMQAQLFMFLMAITTITALQRLRQLQRTI